jgi:hypothetical protein
MVLMRSGPNTKVMRKAKMSFQSGQVKQVIRTYAVEIQTGDKRDLEEESVTLKLRKAMGANCKSFYTFQLGNGEWWEGVMRLTMCVVQMIGRGRVTRSSLVICWLRRSTLNGGFVFLIGKLTCFEFAKRLLPFQLDMKAKMLDQSIDSIHTSPR